MSDNSYNSAWDESVDVLIIGSGNGAMTAAICCHEMGQQNVLTIEKSKQFGGTSSISGGGVWIPTNRYALEAGAQDSLEEARDYLRSVIPVDEVSDELLDTYLENGPRVVDFLHNNTEHVRYESLEHYPDYFSDNPGAKPGHRSMEPAKINISRLGDEWQQLRLSHHMMWMFDNIAFNQTEANILVSRLKGWGTLTMKLIGKYLIDIPWRLKSKKSREIAMGCAGIARLRLAMKDRDLPLWLNTEMKELVQDDSGRICGVVAERDGKTIRIQASKAVVLACGGFEHNQAMREKYLPAPTNSEWSSGHKGNTGDGIDAGIAAGAATAMMDGAWWCTTISVPGEERPRLSIMEKSLPGLIQVNMSGERIANESQNYMTFLLELFDKHTEHHSNVPSYQIFDWNFRNKYVVGPILGKMTSEKKIPEEYFANDFLYKADTIEELAEKTGIDVDGLKESVRKMNEYSKTGKDLDLQRGDAHYDRYYGDPEVKPNPCLGPIDTAPFYAMKVDPGDFGTHGGLEINQHAQVLREDNSVIEGLYATGNVARAILPPYPGPGSTLGPAMTFAYQAAKNICGYQDH